jgi:hypothetical protein
MFSRVSQHPDLFYSQEYGADDMKVEQREREREREERERKRERERELILQEIFPL